MSFASLDSLAGEIQILANGLADIPRKAFEIRQDLARRAWTRMEIGGANYSFNNVDESSLGLNAIFRYAPPLFTLWVEGTPLSGIPNIEFGGAFNVVPFLGIGATYGLYFDNAIDYVDLSYLHLGFIARPRLNFELGLFAGGALGGTVWTGSSEVSGIPGTWAFVSNFSVWLLYKLNDNLTFLVKYLGVSLGPFQGELDPGYCYPDGDYEYISGKLTVSAMYNFTIGGPGARRRP